MYYVPGGAYLAFGRDFVPLVLRAMENMNMPETIPPHILIVDDDPQIRDLLQEYFTSNELRASVTSSGKEMTGILVDHSIDLVVLDLRLAEFFIDRCPAYRPPGS
jgi:response regulator RpfG family c-di-GMP phosphodiesterase